MPKVASHPARASDVARSTAAANAAVSRIRWSAGSTSTTASAPIDRLRVERAQRDRRRGVAPERLEQVRPALRFGVRQPRAGVHILGVKVIVAIGDGHESGHAGQRRRAQCGLSEQRVAVGQGHEGLGRGLPRERPKTCSGAAGKDDRNEGHRHAAPAKKVTSEEPALYPNVHRVDAASGRRYRVRHAPLASSGPP